MPLMMPMGGMCRGDIVMSPEPSLWQAIQWRGQPRNFDATAMDAFRAGGNDCVKRRRGKDGYWTGCLRRHAAAQSPKSGVQRRARYAPCAGVC